MTRLAILIAAAFSLSACSQSVKDKMVNDKAADLTLDVYTASPAGFGANSSIIMGETEAIVVDAQFIKSEATNVVNKLRDSGRDLTTIFITHAHPDHFLGATTIKQAFPDAKVVTIADVAAIYPEVAAKKATA